jgi:hypothetical protein
MGRTTELRRALKQRFFASVVDRGFAIDARHQPISTVFRRRAGGRVEIFEVQWEKYGRPRFAVRFGTCPSEGLRIDAKVHAPDDTLPTWCPDAGSLQPRRGASSRSWFRQDSSVLQRLLWRPALRAPADVVNELLTLFPELERYWQTGDAGPHLQFFRLNGGGEGRDALRPAVSGAGFRESVRPGAPGSRGRRLRRSAAESDPDAAASDRRSPHR